jgi:predicted PurR-regulated permease PerM
MNDRWGTSALVWVIATVAVCAALAVAESVFAPIAFALFIIAIVWPLQRVLQAFIPAIAALAICIVAIVLVIATVVSMVVWGGGHVGQWLIANAGRFQVLYAEADAWLAGHGFVLAGMVTDHFDARWVLRLVQDISGRVQTLSSFLVVTVVFVILGLLEVSVFKLQLRSLGRDGGEFMLRAGAEIAQKMQRYMVVRTVMSIGTGAVVWAVTLASGLELAAAWGVLAFALNYIPFVGPFVATLLPTLFALVQFESWRMALVVFACLNLVQFLSGSYLEPRIAGARLSVSPFLVLFAVFFWAFLWGIPGAFIGVPILIAVLTLCANHPSSRWIADLFSGREPDNPLT